MHRSIWSLVCGILALGLSLHSQAASSGKDAVHTLQQLETLTYKQATAYLMYTVQERNPAQRKKLETLLSQADTLVITAATPAISSAWTAYRSALLKDPYDQGEVDAHVLIAMDVAQHSMIEAVEGQLSKVRQGTSIDKNTESLYEALVKMETITAVYLRRVADPMGGVTGASQRLDPQQMAVDFTNHFLKIMAANKGRPETYKELWTAYQKWNFIKGRVIDFNSNSVPYIIATYNDQITGKLQNAINQVSR